MSGQSGGWRLGERSVAPIEDIGILIAGPLDCGVNKTGLLH